MKTLVAGLVLGAVLAPLSIALGQGVRRSFAFHEAEIRGFPSGDVFLAGGGAFDPSTGSVKSGGAFHCAQDVQQGPLAGLRAGEGVRWAASEILSSTGFKCTGAASEPAKTAFSGDHVLVLKADFYRAGDGIRPSFTANLVVSAFDLDPDRPGRQNFWLQGVGCGEGFVNFR